MKKGDSAARAGYRKAYGLDSTRVVHHSLMHAKRGKHGKGAGSLRNHFMNFRNVAEKNHNPIHRKHNRRDLVRPFSLPKRMLYGLPDWMLPAAGLPIAGGLTDLLSTGDECVCES